MNIDETCACGATFHAHGSYASDVRLAAQKWRQQHRCIFAKPEPPEES